MTTPPEGLEWLQKLEQWLRDNQREEVIYAVLVGHRAGYSAVVTNIGKERVKEFIAAVMKSEPS